MTELQPLPSVSPARPDWAAHAAALVAGVATATRVVREEPMAPKTTLRVGGAARLYAEPASLADLQSLLRIARARGLPIFPLGRGSNLVVPDEGVDGLVVGFAHETWSRFEPLPDGRVRVGAGLRLKNLCGLATQAGLAGFEFLEGIPGAVGGALRMNAGAMGSWMFDVVEDVEMISLDGEVRRRAKAELHVDYRHCEELQDAIALAATLRPASRAEAEAIGGKIADYRRKRQESQPREASAGCIFKNPPGTSAGRLIDECGLRASGWGTRRFPACMPISSSTAAAPRVPMCWSWSDASARACRPPRASTCSPRSCCTAGAGRMFYEQA